MATYTREEIKTAFIALLGERPLNRITVKDVVIKCGINRNTFYYYFQDLPALAEAVAEDTFQQIMEQNLSLYDPGECLDAIVQYALQHRSTVLNLYRSTDRERFEISQWRVCGYVVNQYLDTVLEGRHISAEDRQVLHEFICSTLFGWIMGFFKNGLDVSSYPKLRRACELMFGHMNEIIERCEKGELLSPL